MHSTNYEYTRYLFSYFLRRINIFPCSWTSFTHPTLQEFEYIFLVNMTQAFLLYSWEIFARYTWENVIHHSLPIKGDGLFLQWIVLQYSYHYDGIIPKNFSFLQIFFSSMTVFHALLKHRTTQVEPIWIRLIILWDRQISWMTYFWHNWIVSRTDTTICTGRLIFEDCIVWNTEDWNEEVEKMYELKKGTVSDGWGVRVVLAEGAVIP